MKPKLLSIIVPVYNYEKQIEANVHHIRTYLKKKKINYELILVDDGSTDNTAKTLNRLKNKNTIVLRNKSVFKNKSIKHQLTL